MKYLLLLLIPTFSMAGPLPRAIQKCDISNPASSMRFHAQQDAYIDKLLTLIEKLRTRDKPVTSRLIKHNPRNLFSGYLGVGPVGLSSVETYSGIIVSPRAGPVAGISYHYRFWENLHVTGSAASALENSEASTFLLGMGSSW